MWNGVMNWLHEGIGSGNFLMLQTPVFEKFKTSVGVGTEFQVEG